MATKECKGGDISQAGQWIPSGVPVGGDDVYFTENTAAITAGWPTLSAVNLGKVAVTAGCTVNLGSSSNYVEFGNITRLDIANSGGGDIYFKANTITDTFVWESDGQIFIKSNSALVLTNCEVLGGRNTFTIEEGTITYLAVTNCPDQTVAIASGVSTFTELEADEGTITLSKVPATMRLYGNAAAVIKGGTGGTISTLRAAGAAVLTHLGTAAITAGRLFGDAIVTFAGNLSTATVTWTDAWTFGAAVIDTRNSSGNVVITNKHTRGSGGVK